MTGGGAHASVPPVIGDLQSYFLIREKDLGALLKPLLTGGNLEE
ncbi:MULTISPECIES: hypothetical protein [Nitrospirillum]|nr:hypothetical protein [Nitrospirillum amazonense]MEC4593668.1 hypothetical protein [Nitrospirillum amazonense]